MRLLRIVATLVALTAWAPVAAGAAVPLVGEGPVPDGPGRVFADGARVAWPDPAGPVVLRDDASGTTQRIAVPARCRPVDIRSPVVLVRCGDVPMSPPGALLLTFGADGVQPIPDPDSSVVFFDVGRKWVHGQICDGYVHGPLCHDSVYVDWHTGRRLVLGVAARDLDSTALRRVRLRAPQRPFVRQVDVARRIDRGPLVYLPRRGKTRRISACAEGCKDVDTRFGFATWIEEGRARAFDVRRGRFVALAAADGPVTGVAHTSRRAYVTVSAGDGTAQLHSAALRP